jgi:hypothetical protein
MIKFRRTFLFAVLILLISGLWSAAAPVSAAGFTYNRSAAVAWAQVNILYPNRGVDWGSNPHYHYDRYCTNFVGGRSRWAA